MGELISYDNIIFDMGRVLVDYDADLSIRHFTDDPKMIWAVRNVVFHSSEWELLDAGMISEEEGLRGMLRHCWSDEMREVARKSFETWDQYNLFPKEGMLEVVRELKSRGKKVFVLSNASMRLAGRAGELIPEWDLLDGAFFSAPYGLIKPQRQIYEKFLEVYHLTPESCYFIDDLQRNIDGAKKCGIDGWCFTGGRVEELRAALGLPSAEESVI